MTDIRARDILRWLLVGVVVCSVVGLLLATGGYFETSEATPVQSALTGLVAVAFTYTASITTTFPLLYAWAKLARSFPVIENHIVLRLSGLAIIALVGNTLFGAVYMTTLSQTFNVREVILYSWTDPGWEYGRFWLSGSLMFVLAPRGLIKSLRRPVRLAKSVPA